MLFRNSDLGILVCNPAFLESEQRNCGSPVDLSSSRSSHLKGLTFESSVNFVSNIIMLVQVQEIAKPQICNRLLLHDMST